MLGLGRLYDIGLAFAPVDLGTAGFTGKRHKVKGSGVDIVLIYGAGTDGDDPVPSLQEHSAATGGTSAALAVLSTIYAKRETTLDNDETWEKTTQTAAAIMTAVADDAQKQKIYVIHVPAAALSAGFEYISVDQADLSNNAQLACGIYLDTDLTVQRTPANLIASLN